MSSPLENVFSLKFSKTNRKQICLKAKVGLRKRQVATFRFSPQLWPVSKLITITKVGQLEWATLCLGIFCLCLCLCRCLDLGLNWPILMFGEIVNSLNNMISCIRKLYSPSLETRHLNWKDKTILWRNLARKKRKSNICLATLRQNSISFSLS